MYKIIIADDEATIRNGLQKFLAKKYSDFEIVGSYKDGQQVLNHLSNEMVDIIITDINMPVVSGLEVARIIYENRIPTEIIIISGYREFEYAKQAVQYQVKNYILKPISLDELIRTVNNTIEDIQSRSKEELERHQEFQEKQNLIWEVERQYFAFVCMGIMTPNELIKKRVSLMYGEEDTLEHDICAIAKLRIENFEKVLKVKWSQGKDNLYTEFRNSGEYKDDSVKIFQIIQHENDITYFIWLNTNERDKATELVRVYEEKMMREALHKLDITVTISTELYPNIYSIGKEQNLTEKMKLYVSYTMQEDIALKNELLESIWITDKDERYLKWILEEWINLLTQQTLVDGQVEKKALLNCWKKGDMHRLWQELDKKVEVALRGKSPVLLRIQQYIEENFSKDISLEDVADSIYMNASYLSRLFRKETGEKFIDYLIKVRMQKAIELLKMNRFTVNEIAEKVGYRQVQYFRETFKKHTGMTPREYIMKY